MNHLILKNPVYRFKEGRRIIKAEKGIPNGVYYETKMGNALIDSGRYYGGKKVSMPIALGSYYETTDSNGNIIERGRYVGGKKQSFSSTNTSLKKGRKLVEKDGSVYWLGSDGTRTLMKKGTSSTENNESKEVKPQQSNSVKTIIPSTRFAVNNTYRQNAINAGVNNRTQVIALLNKIKDFYTPGTFVADGNWGKDTQAAYDKFMLTMTVPEYVPETTTFNPASFITPEVRQAITNIDYTPDPIELKLVNQTPIYDRTMTRDWLRNNYGSAYGVSGAMRAAVRRILNKQASDNDRLLVKSNEKLYDLLKGYYKKGGSLISKNAVDRFKAKCGTKIKTNKCGSKLKKHQLGGSLNRIPFMQKGKQLPTAPKAEDRYKESYKSWNWPLYKEVTAGSILFPGAKISLTVEGSDTTYMETPPRFPFVKVVSRTAKNNAKTIKWRDLITGQTYPEVRRGNSQEYETLKRRFNTAWNLAK